MELSEIREIGDQLYRIVMSGLAAVNRYDERYTGPVSMRRVSRVLVDPDMPLHEQERASVLAMTRVLSGLATPSGRLVVRLVGHGGGLVSVDMGYGNARVGTAVLESAMDGFSDGIVWTNVDAPNELLSSLRVAGVVLGVPGTSGETRGHGIEHATPVPTGLLHAVGTGMGKEPFALCIVCEPIPARHMKRVESSLWSELDRIGPRIKVSKTRGQTDSTSSSMTSNEGSTGGLSVIGTRSLGQTQSSMSGDSVTSSQTWEHESTGHRILAERLNELDDRLQRGAAEGLWRVGIFIGTVTSAALAKLGTLAVGAFGGESAPKIRPSWQPLSAAKDMLKGRFPDNTSEPSSYLDPAGHELLNVYTSSELAGIMALPCRDMPGYEAIAAPRFGVQPSLGDMTIGKVVNRMQTMDETEVAVSADDLPRHGLVVGMTGSGKTNTVFHLLSQARVPFLVIEPVKTEYRSLMNAIPDLRVYTPGLEGISPIRLNPFWFEYGTSVTLQQHVDSLKSIFCSMFAMYASMPNILEQCLYNVYERKGWCLYDSSNVYARQGDMGPYLSPEFYPTLEDLRNEVDDYMTRSGYAPEQEQNIRSALLVRLDSLMKGGKGLLLNTPEATSGSQLFEKPTVVELDAISDDDEKSLVMALLMLRLYEYLRANSSLCEDRLKHLLVVEEAHRVFRNVPASLNPEIPSLMGKSVGMLSDMLSEIRSYGEGVLIVEQIPTKLAADATKNTNLKIVHRLVSRDDCEYMSAALGITPEDAQFCSLLRRGEALVFAEGMKRPACVSVDLNSMVSSQIDDACVRRAAREFNPLTLQRESYSPMAATVLQNRALASKAFVIARRFARNLLFDDVRNFNDAWEASALGIQRIADRAGYHLGDMGVSHVKAFQEHVLREGLSALPSKMMLVGNHTRLRILLKVYLERALVYSQKPYDHDAKALDQIGAVRFTLLQPLIARVYEDGLGEEEYSGFCLGTLPISYSDGEAVEIIRSWSESEILELLGSGDVRDVINLARQRVEREFAVTPISQPPVSSMTARVVSLLLKDKMTPSLISMLRSELPNDTD